MIQRVPHKGMICSTDTPLWAEWLVVAPAGHTLDDVLSAEYFGEQTGPAKLKVGDVVKVRAQDLSWYVELWVRAIDAALCQVETVVVSKIVLERVTLPHGFDVRYQGPLQKWTIYGDDTALEGGFPTQEAAAKRIEALLKQKKRSAA